MKAITSKNGNNTYKINSFDNQGNYSKVFIQLKDDSGTVTSPSVDKIKLETKEK